MLSPCFLTIFCCSLRAASKHSVWLRRRAPVHVLVVELVCFPAKRMATMSPVTSASVVGRPSLYLESIRFCKTSSSTRLELLRDRTISVKILESLARALSRRRVVGIGAYGNSKQLISCKLFPVSSWNVEKTSSNIFSRTSFPSRQRAEISMSNCSSSCFISTIPCCPHFAKYFCVPMHDYHKQSNKYLHLQTAFNIMTRL